MALLLIGLNHRTTPVEVREQLHLSGECLYAMLTRLQQTVVAVREVVILSTCNRLEMYCIVRETTDAETQIVDFLCREYQLPEVMLKPHLYALQDRLAIRHLMRVASGLDSMILGEAQILGQVKAALKSARTVVTAHTLLHRLFEAAIHAGKRARTETAISQHTTSVSHAAAQLVQQHLGAESEVLIVGAGEMAQLAAQAASDSLIGKVSIINRTYKNALELAHEVGADAYEWSCLWDKLAQVDAVISATGAPHLVLYAEDIRRMAQNRRDKQLLILVDIALPRDIDPAIADMDECIVYDIDALNQVVDNSFAQREACVPHVETIIAEEEARYWAWFNERSIIPVIKDLRQEVQSVIEAELDEALNKLGNLGDYERNVVRRMAHRILNKVLHAPTASLRQHATQDDAENYAEVVRDLFALSDDAAYV